MGNCCKKGSGRQTRTSFAYLGNTFKSIVAPVADDGSEVMNSIAGELWPSVATGVLETMKTQAFPVKPYEMHIVSGVIGNCPHIRDVKLVKGEPGEPVQFTCECHYDGKPELKFQLKGMPGSFASHLLPDVLVELHTISFTAKIHVEMSAKNSYAKFYFIEKPDLVWDLEVEVSQLNIPIHIEDMLDNRVEQEFEKINREHPHEVKFAAEVKVQQKQWSGNKKKKKKSVKEGEEEDEYLEEQTFRIGGDGAEKKKKKKKKHLPRMHGPNYKKSESKDGSSHSSFFHSPSSLLHSKSKSTPDEWPTGDEPSETEPLNPKTPPKKKSSFSFMNPMSKKKSSSSAAPDTSE